MEPAGLLALAVGLVCGVPTLLSAGRRLRLPGSWLAGAALAVVLCKTMPAGAQLPPPPLRWEPAGEGDEESGEDDPTPRPLPVPDSGARTRPEPGAAYRVRPGDSLWAIACRALGEPEQAQVDRYWRAIYRANRGHIGEDPDLIFPGQVFVLPEV